MRKFISLGIIFMMIAIPGGSAQMPVAGPGMMPSPAGLERIGVVAATQGIVEIARSGQAGHVVGSGQPVFMGDEVKTDEKGHLQILLLDQTVFTIGPNSSIVIDKFVYDPKTQDGEIRVTVPKGIFRYVSGKIAAKKPKNVSMKFPTATIGFRGTIVGGQVNQNGGGFAGLLGPGDNNNAGEQAGSFVIEGSGGNGTDNQEVNRSGFGVEFGADGSLSDPFQLSDQQINTLTSGLLPPGGSGGAGGAGGGGGSGGSSGGSGGDSGGGGGGSDGGGFLGGGSAADLSGENNASGFGNAGDTTTLTGFADTTGDLTGQAAQDHIDTSGGAATDIGNVTTYEQLASVTTGTGHYDFSCAWPGGGNLVGKLNIDFSQQSIGGGDSFLQITDSPYQISTINDGEGSQCFQNISGSGTFQWTNVDAVNGYEKVGTFNTITVALSNANDVIAQKVECSVDYKGGGGIAAGTVTTSGTLQSDQISQERSGT